MPSPNYTSRASTVPPSHVNSAEAAFRPDDLRISRPIEILRESNGGLNQQLSTRLMSVDGTWPRKGANATSRASAGPSMLNDSLSSGPSRGSLSKKNGGFRATIRRMFGSKRHRDTMESVGDGYHYYKSGNLTPVETSVDDRQAKTSSQLVSDVARSSALGSHAPQIQLEPYHPDLESSSSKRDTIPPGRRRNTLPSVALSFHEAQMLAAALGEIGMRPSSKPTPHPESEPVHGLERRSRSADALLAEARTHQMSPIQWRRRSGEIQYWRNSVLENPIPKIIDTHRATKESLDSDRAPFRSFAPSPSTHHRSVSRDSLKQFQFGSFAGVGVSTGIIEQRVTTLEVKFTDLEYAIARLQGCDLQRPPAPAKSQKRRSIQDLWPQTSTLPTSPSSTKHGHTFLISPAASPTPTDEFETPTQLSRSSNAPTIRVLSATDPYHTSPSTVPPSHDDVTPDQFNAIMALFASEQAARHQLEAQVRELQAQIDELRSGSYTAYRPSAYPTPSPESRASPIAFRGKRTRRSLGLSRSPVGSDETSRFSSTDADESGTDDGDGDGFQDVYETPRERYDSNFRNEREIMSPRAAGMI